MHDDKDLIFVYFLHTDRVTCSHASQVRTVPFTNCRHIGHFLMAGAQSVQQKIWQHGNMALEASFSIQVLHILRSFICPFSSINKRVSVRVRSEENKKKTND